MFKSKILALFILSFTLIGNPLADELPSTKASDVIKNLYEHLPPHADKEQKIAYFSHAFLGKPYQLAPLGEGKNATFNTNPLYRTDAFDCLTFVETVLALSLAHTPKSFKKTLSYIRYKNGEISLTTRNHFPSADWLPNNMKNGFIKDITTDIKNKNGLPVYKIATTIIDKKSWYRKRGQALFSHPKPSAKLSGLLEKTDNIRPQYVETPYIPLSALFAEKKANQTLFNQIPGSSIIWIVRPNWQLKEKIGTNLNISHLGFAIRDKGKLYFREASSKENKVVDIPLETYLKELVNSSTIKGINISVIK